MHRGPAIYAGTYDAATAGLRLPCPDHAGLWPNNGIPYPPLGVLAHLPFALAERVLPPSFVHRLLTFSFGLVALASVFLAARALPRARRWVFVGLFGPLLIGVGLSGFFDVLWVAAALAAIERRSLGLAGCSFLLHFRGIGALAFHRPRWHWVLVPVLLNVGVAWVAQQHLGEFGANSRVHFSHPASGWLPLTAVVAAYFLRRDGLAAPLLSVGALMYIDRQVAFWHLTVLVPLAFAALRRAPAHRAFVVLAWCAIVAQAYLDTWVPFPIYWLTQR